MKHITRWRPDTCSCVLELEWDDEVPEAERTHEAVKVERCAVHQHQGEPHQAVFESVIGENRHKNEVHQHLIETLPEDHVVVDEKGRRGLKHQPRFEFDENRELRVTFPNAPAGVKSAARTALKARAFTRAVGVN